MSLSGNESRSPVTTQKGAELAGKQSADSDETGIALASIHGAITSMVRRGLGVPQAVGLVYHAALGMFLESLGSIPEGSLRDSVRACLRQGDPQGAEEEVSALVAHFQVSLYERTGLMRMASGSTVDGDAEEIFYPTWNLPYPGEEALSHLEIMSTLDWGKVEVGALGAAVSFWNGDGNGSVARVMEFTPRSIGDQLIEAVIIKHAREEWANYRGPGDDPMARMVQYHEWLCGLQVLDPACGSGNLLCFAMEAMHKLEAEFSLSIGALAEGAGVEKPALGHVKPEQFKGIELNPAAAIACEISLWVTYLRLQGKRGKELEKCDRLAGVENRDALIRWESTRRRPEKDRVVPRRNGKPGVALEYAEYLGVREASWPGADYIVANPPFPDKTGKRQKLGDGYVDALMSLYPKYMGTSDLCYFWLRRIALLISNGRAIGAGMVVPSTAFNGQNRTVTHSACHEFLTRASALGTPVEWPNPGKSGPQLMVVLIEIAREAEPVAPESPVYYCGNPPPLKANAASTVTGSFGRPKSAYLLSADEAKTILASHPHYDCVLPRHVGALDLTQGDRCIRCIDFRGMALEAVQDYPELSGLIEYRMGKRIDSSTYESSKWWEVNSTLSRGPLVVSPRTAKHTFFTRLKEVCVHDLSTTRGFHVWNHTMGIMNSSIYSAWSSQHARKMRDGSFAHSKAGFLSFPFPDASPQVEFLIAGKCGEIEAHRHRVLERNPKIGFTALYNAVMALRRGTPMTAAEAKACDAFGAERLCELHNELDALVAEAYGWPWPMSDAEIVARLLTLHAERVAEEAAGKIRYIGSPGAPIREGACADPTLFDYSTPTS